MQQIENDTSAHASRLARLLRHEVGDLLQSIYSAITILHERLPESLLLEHRLLRELKDRAEICRLEIDAIVGLVASAPLANSDECLVELSPLLEARLAEIRYRFPQLRAAVEIQPGLLIRAEVGGLALGFSLLLVSLAQAARQLFRVRAQRTGEGVWVLLERDGFAVPPEQLEWLHRPFATTQNALFGLALVTIDRVAQAANGQLTVVAPPANEGGGVKIRLNFPSPEGS